jgi:hypothetical protein
MARHLELADGPTTVCPIELALEVGIRASSTDPLGKKSHLVHAIDRLCHDHVVARLGDRALGVGDAVPPLSPRTLAELPAPAREAHQRFLAIAREAPWSTAVAVLGSRCRSRLLTPDCSTAGAVGREACSETTTRVPVVSMMGADRTTRRADRRTPP